MTYPRALSFVEMIDLVPIARQNMPTCDFMGKHSSYNPGSGLGFGGHVYAQSVWAAAQTVPDGMFIHNVHGYFTLPAYTDRPLFYNVQTTSSGNSYCTRFVTVKQPMTPCTFPYDVEMARETLGDNCFVSMCSFKKEEPLATNHQIKADLTGKYAKVLKENPNQHREAPEVDSPWWYLKLEAHPELFRDDFPGLDIRKVDMTKYNDSKPPEEQRQLHYYQPIGILPKDLPNLHACAHLYASDRNSLFIIPNAVGFGDEVGSMGSLSHSVVFHGNGNDLLMKQGDWWCQEASTPRSGNGRGMHESRIWNSNGILVASTWQDGLVRKAKNEDGQKQRLGWLKWSEEFRLARNIGSGPGKHKL